jgi:hypothetical protein
MDTDNSMFWIAVLFVLAVEALFVLIAALSITLLLSLLSVNVPVLSVFLLTLSFRLAVGPEVMRVYADDELIFKL